MMAKRDFTFFIVSITLSIATFSCGYGLSNLFEKTRPVVVARRNLRKLETIALEDVELVEFPASSIRKGMVFDVNRVVGDKYTIECRSGQFLCYEHLYFNEVQLAGTPNTDFTTAVIDDKIGGLKIDSLEVGERISLSIFGKPIVGSALIYEIDTAKMLLTLVDLSERSVDTIEAAGGPFQIGEPVEKPNKAISDPVAPAL